MITVITPEEVYATKPDSNAETILLKARDYVAEKLLEKKPLGNRCIVVTGEELKELLNVTDDVALWLLTILAISLKQEHWNVRIQEEGWSSTPLALYISPI